MKKENKILKRTQEQEARDKAFKKRGYTYLAIIAGAFIASLFVAGYVPGTFGRVLLIVLIAVIVITFLLSAWSAYVQMKVLQREDREMHR